MKPIPTASQTVGPFFSIGFAPLYQNAPPITASTIRISGAVFDGDGKPIPDAVLEFWNAQQFGRVPTSEGGKFAAILETPLRHGAQGGKGFVDYFDVLVFMRGLLKPVYTRVYFADADILKNDPALMAVPPDRIETLVAKPAKSVNECEWNIFMQGENETVFFEF